MLPEKKFMDNLIQLIDKHDEVHTDIPYFEDLIPDSELGGVKKEFIIERLLENGFIKKSKVEHVGVTYFAVTYKHEPMGGLRMFGIQSGEYNEPTKSKKENKVVKKEEFTLSEEDILEMANTAVKAIKEKDIVKTFDMICLPFDDGKGYKEKLFLKIFELLEIPASYEKGIGVIVPAKNEKKRVVVSHMDLIPTFNKGFKESRKYIIEDNKIIGALDNTITNAVAMITAFHTKAKDTEFVFTEGEETGFWGMKAYIKKRHEKHLYYINMDVTNDAWNNHVSVEYDDPCWEICCQINDNMNAGFTTDRVCDDLDVVVDNKGYGLSYCLPTKKTIHSWNNYTMLDKLNPYLEGLFFLIEDLDISVMDKNIHEVSINKALKCETFEDLKKKEKKAKKKREKKRKKYFSGYSKSSRSHSSSSTFRDEDLGIVHSHVTGSGQKYFDFGGGLVHEDEVITGLADMPVKEDTFEDLIDEDFVSQVDIMNLEYVVKDAIDTLEHNGVSVDKFLANFIHEKTFAQSQWSKDDLAGFIGDLDKAEEVILTLDDNYLIKTIEPGSVFKFPARSEYS